jgi:elongation factor 3
METAQILDILYSLLPSELLTAGDLRPNETRIPKHPLLLNSLRFQATLLVDLVYTRKFSDQEKWNRCSAPYMELWIGKEESLHFAQAVLLHFLAAEKVYSCHSFIHRLNIVSLDQVFEWHEQFK